MASSWVGRILWIDGLAALAAGVSVLAARRFLAGLYDLPLALVTIGGVVNLTYAAYSLTLASRRRRRAGFITALALANTLWAGICVAVALHFRNEATVIGLASVLFEAAFVGNLGVIEWRCRSVLARG
jgi:hypothetical protein